MTRAPAPNVTPRTFSRKSRRVWELQLHLVHILLGGGTSLFGSLDGASLALERTRLIDAEGVTHLSFRVERPG